MYPYFHSRHFSVRDACLRPVPQVVAMALSGFTNEKKALWHEISAELRPSLTDPYIRAIFSFLTAEADNYDGVLVSSGGRERERHGQ